MNLWHLFATLSVSFAGDRKSNYNDHRHSKSLGIRGASTGVLKNLDHMVIVGESIKTRIGIMDILKKLGEGSYGAVFEAFWKAGRRNVAFKVEKPPEASIYEKNSIVPRDYSRITYEYRMMEKLNNTYGFPLVYTANMDGKYKFYAMQKLGKSLSKLRKDAGGRLRTRQVIDLAGQILERLEVLHRRGILMYDLHEGNFLLHRNTLYVIDLGMAFPYIIAGKHVSEGASFIPPDYKNHVFASRRDSKGQMVSRRDELERFLYLIVMLNVGSLPWDKHEKRSDRIQHKLEASLSEVCHDEAAWLRPAFEYVDSMKFQEEPNYEFFRLLFQSRLKQIKQR